LEDIDFMRIFAPTFEVFFFSKEIFFFSQEVCFSPTFGVGHKYKQKIAYKQIF